MPAYTKLAGDDDDWRIVDEEGRQVAATETERLADVLMAYLTGMVEIADYVGFTVGQAYDRGE